MDVSSLDERDWDLLNHDEPDIAVSAAGRLITRAMYLE
jgi:hypothetical protein